MNAVYESQSYVDFAYMLGKSNKNRRFDINGTSVYVFVKDSVLVSSVGDVCASLSISHETKIEDIIDFSFNIIGEGAVPIVETEIEELTVDRVENIYCTLLTKDNHSVVLTEDFFDKLPKDGDVLDGNLNILAKKTQDKKDTINALFSSLIKR